MITIEVGKHTSLIYLPIQGVGHLSISMDGDLDSREQRAEQRADARCLIESLADLTREGQSGDDDLHGWCPGRDESR